ncbi:MAG: hypothetical protein PCFJNLEI_03771 [Verrucomicrobiae bacterium]|nr:hypothetical protein [Verrucomicrobiae bacterium]
MKFIHGYDERYLLGLEKHGLWNAESGLKVTQHFATPTAEKFNSLAAGGGKLQRLIRDRHCPLYIDRLQGGTFYQRYAFDLALLREYQELLGDWFLGIQMHEWGSGCNADWNRIRNQLATTPPPWTEQQIHAAIKAVSVNQECIHLSCGTALEYSRKHYAETWPEYLDELAQLFQLRQDENAGLLLPCDSYTQATGLEYQLGARTVMPEIGAQIPMTRLQVALARGLSRARGRPWGVYYEPWGGKPFSAPHFFDGPLNEWRVDKTSFAYDFTTYGPNGGSSRALQRRLYYYALLSGAHYLAEEWGVSNTFQNWRDYPLTPYGEIKKDFINFAATRPRLEPFVPFAIVLPRECAVIDLFHLRSPETDVYLNRTLGPADRALFGHVRSVLRLFFAAAGTSLGNEAHVLTNNRLADCFDVLDEDAAATAGGQYSCLIDASPDCRVARANVGGQTRTLLSTDLARLESEIMQMIGVEFPCTVGGGIHWLLNRQGQQWWLALFNNNGVERSTEHGDSFLSEANLPAVIHFKREPARLRLIKNWPATQEPLVRQAAGRYICSVAPGGFCLLEFHLPG